MSQTVLEAAQEYVRRGWAVLPVHSVVGTVCTCGRSDCQAPGKHPRTRNGVKDASKDPAQVARWWTMWPDASVAIATGSASGVFVVDVDPRHGGYDSLDEYEMHRQEGPLPATVRVRTGGGGLHLYFRLPDDGPVPSRAGWLPGVDIKSDGGYVLAPPSRHVSGGAYEAEGGALAHAPVDLLWAVRMQRSANGATGGGRATLPSTEELLNGVEEGNRDNALLGLARRVLNQTNGDVTVARAVLMEAARNCSPPFPETDALAKLQQAYRYWQEEAQSRAEGREWAEKLGLADGKLENTPTTWPGYGDFTDVGHAQRLAWRLGLGEDDGPKALWAPGRTWWVWDERKAVWRRDEDGTRVAAEVQGLVPLLQLEAEAAPEDARKQALGSLSRVRSAAGITNCLRVARSLDGLWLEDDDAWDPDPWLLNCANGVVNLRTGELLPHHRRHRMTQRSPVAYDPNAPDPAHWLELLGWIVPDEAERAWLHRALGYSVTGSTGAKAFFILTGTGNNGKSTLLETVAELVGEYAKVASKELFIKQAHKSHAQHLARLQGGRFVRCGEEVGRNESLNTEQLKTLTGGDKVTANFMRENAFEFTWRGKLWLASNHTPHVSEWGTAMQTRVRLLQLEPIPPDRIKPMTQVHSLLRSEWAGILRWLVDGAAEVARLGEVEALRAPETMTESADAIMEGQDRVASWFNERWATSREAQLVATGELFVDFEWWLAANGETPDSPGVRCSSHEELGRRLNSVVEKWARVRKLVNGERKRGFLVERR